ncbi:hypothetical protein SIO17_00960 [Pseudoalteromonas piscicida]|uniref:Uncharacterized protein n=1 Tax=Pseudoalteromonas piscicida TaxID=43662 RepID=A0ABN5CFF0_PSEO7|nr:hypothetical protein [Pseudoalteromonas piscicida]ATD05557.1 hypothetical protein PPIS_a0207 [Pseudoalteromonas piscicida]WPU32348.1 hypothetical protein SIO17_00960 [Pseudoalteromonas piscicida]
MSITPYQYQLLTQTLASIRPNFHGFCTSWYNQIQHYDLRMQIPTNVGQLIIWEHQIFDFVQNCVMRIPQQSNLLHYLQKQRGTLLFMGTSEKDISVLLFTFYSNAKKSSWQAFYHSSKKRLEQSTVTHRKYAAL